MIRHILLIRFKPEASGGEIARLKEQFLAIPTKIAGVNAVEWGENNSPEGKNQGYTHCVMMSFADENTREQYLPHPEHLALVAIFRPVLDNIIVFDYAPDSR